MIPNAENCRNYGEFGCPTLFDDLESFLSVVLAKTREALPDNLGDSMSGFVGLPPIAVDNGDVVIVYPEKIKAIHSRKNPALVRTQVQASAVVVFSDWPGVLVENGEFTVPAAEESHEATRFVTSIAWCVWCEVLNQVANGSLLTGVNLPGFDATAIDMEITDFGGDQAGFEIHATWTA